MASSENSDKINVRNQRGMAIFLIFVGVIDLVTQKLPGSALSGIGMILYALCLFNNPAPSLRSTPRETYQAARKGAWRMSKYARIVSLVAFTLVIAGLLLQLKN
jgi:hypothetical protein